MRRHTVLLAAAAVLVLALAVAACGDDDDAPRGESRDGALGASGGGFTVGADASEGLPPSDRDTVANVAPQSAPQPAEDGAGSIDVLGRTIIRNGGLTLEVESVTSAFESVNAVAVANGGFVADSALYRNGDEEGSQFGRLTLRVPADRFQQTIDDLRELAIDVASISTSSQDVTGEVTDLESDLRNLLAVEAQYLELLGRADQIGDILQVQDRLTQTRAQIERIEGRMALLASLSDLATLQVELRTPLAPLVEEGGSGPLHAAEEAWEASLATLGGIATVGIVVVVYSWWLLPLVVIAALTFRRWAPRRLIARYD